MSGKRDFYEILGVARTASADEIKRSYRKLAYQFHPDRNPGDTAAEDKFKEAAEAYEILSNDEKRRRYDQFGHAGVNGPAGGAGFSSADDVFEHFGSIFEDLFGMGSNRRSGRGGGNRQRKGEDLRYDLRIDLKDTVLGSEHQIRIPRRLSCTTCSGSGAAPGTKQTQCRACGGRGQVAVQQGFFTFATTCPDCNGQGKRIESPCSDCKGTSFQTKTSEIKVKIPAGIDSGMRLRVAGEGEAGSNGGPAGDLYVFIEVLEQAPYSREEFDLIYHAKIGVAQAILGSEIEVDCFDQVRKVDIPAGVQPGERIRVPGAGIPKLEKYGKGRGDLIVHISVEIPSKISKDAEEHLRLFAQKHGETVKANGNGFFKNLFT